MRSQQEVIIVIIIIVILIVILVVVLFTIVVVVVILVILDIMMFVVIIIIILSATAVIVVVRIRLRGHLWERRSEGLEHSAPEFRRGWRQELDVRPSSAAFHTAEPNDKIQHRPGRAGPGRLGTSELSSFRAWILCGMSTAFSTPRRRKLAVDISRRPDRKLVGVRRRSSFIVVLCNDRRHFHECSHMFKACGV